MTKSLNFTSNLFLLLPDASPNIKDPGRGFTAKDWARLCGRKFCADSIAEIMKRRNAVPQRAINDYHFTERKKMTELYPRNKSTDKRRDGTFHCERKNVSVCRVQKFKISVNFSSVGFSSKIRSFFRVRVNSENDTPEIDESVILEVNGINRVPIVEITPAHNQHLINKYKNYATKVDELPTEMPLRRKSCNV